MRNRFPFRKPSSQSVRFKAICSIHDEVGFVVVPAMYTRRVAISITNNVKYVTSPRAVHTSVVKKSAAATRCACERTNVHQLMGRTEEGWIPCSFSTFAIVLLATR
jgi:hypothetical protein